jgi:hypothetical protein
VPKKARRRQDSPLARAQVCPKGHRIVRSSTAWLEDVRNHPAFLLRRGDAQRNILAVAIVLAAYTDWETSTTRPTWAKIMERGAVVAALLADDPTWQTSTTRPTWAKIIKCAVAEERTTLAMSRRAVGYHLAFLHECGLLATVEHGTTPQYSPGVLTLGPDGQARNSAAVYLLIAPTHLRAVAQTHPEDVGAEWVEAGPVDAVEAAADEAEAGLAPPPLLASLPSLAPVSTSLDRSAPHRTRPSVDLTCTPSPSGGGLDPHVRAREIRNLQDPELRRPDPAWARTQRPASKAERRLAALEARRVTPDLARLTTPYVAALFREWHLAGWTLADVLTALGRAPDGPAAAGYRHTTDVRHVPAWVRSRLAAWRSDPLDPSSPPGASPSARTEAARAHQRAQARAVRERSEAAVVAHRVDSDQDTRAAVDVAGLAALRRALREKRRHDGATGDQELRATGDRGQPAPGPADPARPPAPGTAS